MADVTKRTYMSKATRMYLTMVVEPQVRKFCGPLFFTSSMTTPKDNVDGSGTFGLVHIGNRKLLTTCWHVFNGFSQRHQKNPELRFAIGFGGRFPQSVSCEDLLNMKVDDDSRCDLATFDVADALDLVAASNLEFFDLNVNRPPSVQKGDVLYFIGFPGKGRIEDDSFIAFPGQPIAVQASEVGHFTFNARITSLSGDPIDYAGVSGAPCFVVMEGRPIKLVGFVTGFAPGQTNMLQFTYARYIGSDGVLRYMS